MVSCSRLSAGHYADYSGSDRSRLPGNLSRWKQNISIGRKQSFPCYSKENRLFARIYVLGTSKQQSDPLGQLESDPRRKGKEWELYDVVKDRTERNNLAEQHPEVLTKLVTEWEKWANANFVLPKHPKK